MAATSSSESSTRVEGHFKSACVHKLFGKRGAYQCLRPQDNLPDDPFCRSTCDEEGHMNSWKIGRSSNVHTYVTATIPLDLTQANKTCSGSDLWLLAISLRGRSKAPPGLRVMGLSEGCKKYLVITNKMRGKRCIRQRTISFRDDAMLFSKFHNGRLILKYVGVVQDLIEIARKVLASTMQYEKAAHLVYSGCYFCCSQQRFQLIHTKVADPDAPVALNTTIIRSGS